MSTDELTHQGEVKTPMHCHHCSKEFIALIDYSVNGNHEIECPNCGHGHQRVIKNGKMTEERWGSTSGGDANKSGHKARRVWKNDSLPMKTTSASEFMRQRWLEKGLK